MQHMHGIIPKLFDCWANPVAHLLLLKSSMAAVNHPQEGGGGFSWLGQFFSGQSLYCLWVGKLHHFVVDSR